MERAVIRLEVLKLCARGGRNLTETLAEARAFENYILEEELQAKADTDLKKSPLKKKTDNSDILS